MAIVEFYETQPSAAFPGDTSAQAPVQYRWRVRADNGEIVASGEAYTRPQDAERGFEDAARAFADAADRRAAL